MVKRIASEVVSVVILAGWAAWAFSAALFNTLIRGKSAGQQMRGGRA